MEYKRLNFEQYFIDTSLDYGETGKARKTINYESVNYTYKNHTFTAKFEIHYEEDRDVIQINFKETDGKLDWLTNFLFTSKYYDTFKWENKKITLRVHHGWAARYKAIKWNIRNMVGYLLQQHPTATVEIIGWSLGSGQACLCAQDLNYNLGIKPYLYTFGSVNLFRTHLFNNSTTIRYLKSCCSAVYNFADVNDIVGYVVPRIFGFIKPNRVNLRQHKFRLFKGKKYHTEYWKPELYEGIV